MTALETATEKQSTSASLNGGTAVNHGQAWRRNDRAWAAWTYETVSEAIEMFGTRGTFLDVLGFFAGKRNSLAKAYRSHEAELFGVWRDENLAPALRTRTTFFGPSCPPYDKATLAYHEMLGIPQSRSIEGVIRARLGHDVYELTSFKCDATGDDPRGRLWIHTHWRNVRPIMNHCRELFETILEPISDAEAMSVAAELHWWFVHALPFARGTTSIAEWLISYAFRVRGAGSVRYFEDPAAIALVVPNYTLYRAAFAKNIELVPQVTGAPVPEVGPRLLAHAARQGHTWRLKRLLARWRPNVPEPTGYTALHLAARGGHARAVKALLAANAPVNAVHVDSGETPLHLAARNGHERVVKLLRVAGATLSQADLWGNTALHLAVREEQESVVRYLIAEGASLSAADELGRLPLHYAAERGNRKMADLLVARGRLQSGINSADLRGDTALSLAALGGHVKTVQFLLKHSATPPLQDPRLLAIRVGHIEAERVLLDAGVDASWYRLLCRTAERGHAEVCALLQQRLLSALPASQRKDVAPLLPRAAPHSDVTNVVSAKGLDGLSASLAR